jgi:hypothetical protein
MPAPTRPRGYQRRSPAGSSIPWQGTGRPGDSQERAGTIGDSRDDRVIHTLPCPFPYQILGRRRRSPPACFNPHPARSPGATCRGRPGDPAVAVSTRTRRDRRVRPPPLSSGGCAGTRFNPHPARSPGATQSGFPGTRPVPVSTLTRRSRRVRHDPVTSCFSDTRSGTNIRTRTAAERPNHCERRPVRVGLSPIIAAYRPTDRPTDSRPMSDGVWYASCANYTAILHPYGRSRGHGRVLAALP